MAAASDPVVTVFGGTGFLGRRIVRHLGLHGFCVRVASRHPDRGHALLPPDDLQLRSIKADVHDQRSVADALVGAYGAVNAVGLYFERRDGRRFIPSTSSLPNGSQLGAASRNQTAHPRFGMVPIPARNRSISESAAKANWRFGRPLPMSF